MVKKKCPECGELLSISFWDHYWSGKAVICEKCTSIYFYRRKPWMILLLIALAIAIGISFKYLMPAIALERHQSTLIFMLVGGVLASGFFYIFNALYDPAIGFRKNKLKFLFNKKVTPILSIALIIFLLTKSGVFPLILILTFLLLEEINIYQMRKRSKAVKRTKLSNLPYELDYSSIESELQEIYQLIENEKYSEAKSIATITYQRHPKNYYAISAYFETFDHEAIFSQGIDTPEDLIDLGREIFLNTRLLRNHYIGWNWALNYYSITKQYKKTLILHDEYGEAMLRKYLKGVSLGKLYLNGKTKSKWVRFNALRILKGYFGSKQRNQYAWQLREEIKKAT